MEKTKAEVTYDDSILLGDFVVCDGLPEGRPVSVFTHIHKNHIKHFGSCLSSCDVVLVSPFTRDLLIRMKGTQILRYQNFMVKDWGLPYTYKDETITLFPTKHILGSSQILVKSENRKIVYTGDFDFPNTKPLKSDTLVIDATYGNPSQRKKFDQSVLYDEIIHLVKRELIEKEKPIYIFSRRGRIQHFMCLLRKEGIDVPFIAPLIETKLAEVYKNHGEEVGECLPDPPSIEGYRDPQLIARAQKTWEIKRDKKPYVAFYTLGSVVPMVRKYTRIEATAFGAPFSLYKTEDRKYVLAITDHADFEGILEYVRSSDPEIVIVDSSRSRFAAQAATAINDELGVTVMVSPPILVNHYIR